MASWDEFKCREVFALFDTDGEGKIAVSMIGEVLRAIGQNPTNREILKAISGHKATDKVDFQFFLPIAQNMASGKQVSEQEFLDCLLHNENIESKDNTSVKKADLKYMLTHLGERLTDAEVDEVLADQGDNINCIEFVRMMMSYEEY